MRKAPLLILALAAAGLAAAAAARPAPVDPQAAPFQVGAFKVFALRDALNVVDNDGKTFGVGVDPAVTAEVLRKAGAPTDAITLSVGGLLVRGEGRVMLFDTGLGPRVHGALAQSLAAAGVRPGEVTDVFITHSHFDHVGGLVGADGALAFPNAAIHLSEPEWAFLQAKPPSPEFLRAITPKVAPFAPGARILPEVRALATSGHTPGHSGYEIVSRGDRLIDIGDLAHSSIISLARPDWTIAYDADADQGRARRLAELKRLAAGRERVYAPHFPYPSVGRIEAAGDGYVWRPEAP